jgi:hypothetical protein
MEYTVKIGDIVTIVSDASMYNGKQGEVVEIVEDDDEDGPVGVKFHKSQIFNYVRSEEECVIRHEERELKIDTGWNVQTRALKMYPNMYHSMNELLFDFDPRNPCMQAGCAEDHSERRCVINIWGTVIERDLCTEHSKFDGMLGESFETRKDYRPFTPIRERKAA